MLMPPGYTSSSSLRGFIQAFGARTEISFAPDIEQGEALIGTPDQVGERLVRNMERAGAGIFMGAFQVGDMPHAKVMRNLELFATKVMPYLPRATKPAAGA
jgi:alkanesulfonate monooxygenase SsuD/methylene tetrahydromethanopterin reductase-like flavin-dependent oxidoreductase (luciferase family)